MRRTVVDDVQVACYYLKVPRVTSGLPVYGGLIGWAICAAFRLRENSGLALKKYGFGPETRRTEDALAETSCENLGARILGHTRGYAGKADETERLRTGNVG